MTTTEVEINPDAFFAGVRASNGELCLVLNLSRAVEPLSLWNRIKICFGLIFGIKTAIAYDLHVASQVAEDFETAVGQLEEGSEEARGTNLN